MSSVNLTIAIFNETTGWSLPKALVERVREAAGPDVEVRAVTGRDELLATLPETHYLVGFPLTEEVFSRTAKNVQWVQLTNSSGDTIGSLRETMKSGVRVTTASSVRAPQIAEHALALTLGLLRRLDRSIMMQEEHHWGTNQLASEIGTLSGATVGLVSMGAQAHELSQRLKAFGAHLIVLQHSSDDPFFDADMTLPFSELDELMARSDVVIVATPRLPSMEGLISRRQIKRMRRSAILINVSRGGVVNEEALLEGLQRNRLRAAGLDVFETEPLPQSSPFWTMPNVIVTPHVGSVSPNYWGQAVDLICHNLQRLRENRPLIDEMTVDWFDRSFL